MRVCSLLGGACRGSISGGTLVVGGLVAMRLLLCVWLGSEVSGREDGGGESQWTDENSESPIWTWTRKVWIKFRGVRQVLVQPSQSRSELLDHLRRDAGDDEMRHRSQSTDLKVNEYLCNCIWFNAKWVLLSGYSLHMHTYRRRPCRHLDDSKPQEHTSSTIKWYNQRDTFTLKITQN